MFKHVLSFFVASMAFASEHGGTRDTSINWWHLGSEYAQKPALGWWIVTFVTFVGLLVYFVKKPLGAFLEARTHSVRQAIEEARIAKEAAEKKASEYAARLQALEQETSLMQEQFAQQAAQQSAAVIKAAQRLAAQISKDAEESIAAAQTKAMDDLKKHAAELAVQLAAKELERSGVDVESVLAQRFVRDVSELPQ